MKRFVTDLRGISAVTMFLFGLLLLGQGLFGTTEEDLAKTGGIALNLWTGAALLVVGLVFAVAAARSTRGSRQQ
ncbi:hypothetical protein [Kineococcus sp. SYSU DK003]|uniref:hypothetical protein n=1 Tax=Kineococcus sp. SYSU DK003 TaxID=3383124 RepID=UPI003D7C8B21